MSYKSINIVLFVVSIVSLPKHHFCNAETVAEKTLFNCARAMSAPVRFRVSIGRVVIPQLENGHLAEASKKLGDKRMNFLVSKSVAFGEDVTMVESLSPLFENKMLNIGSKNYEILPKQKYAIEVSFRSKEGQPNTAEMTVFDLKGLVSMSDDEDAQLLISVQTDEKEIKIRVNRATNFAESKQIYDRSSGVLLKDYRYTDVVRNPVFAADAFSIPSDYALDTGVTGVPPVCFASKSI